MFLCLIKENCVVVLKALYSCDEAQELVLSVWSCECSSSGMTYRTDIESHVKYHWVQSRVLINYVYQ